MANRTIQTDSAPAAMGAYSQGVQSGSTLYISGQLGLDPKSGLLLPTFSAQADQTFTNIRFILEEAEFNLNDVVKVTIFMTDLADFGVLNKLMGNLFASDYYPARSTVQVLGLPKGGLIEVDAIAIR
ncbi:Rid family detoxifying hydrolase [Burkholderiales bacterium]|nr:Rid family detoxifying hydrolase [Burkholderiales bacterium]